MAAVSNMAVNSAARLWGPFRSLYDTVDAAVFRKQPGAAYDLEVALRKHKPDFISLLKKPAKNNAHREAVKKATTEGLVVQGEQRTQTLSQQFISEALIISDLFDMNELAAVELLMAGENQLPNYPGLTRGLVAVLLYYDGRRSLVNSLRAMIQAREGRTWSLGVPSDVVYIITQFTDQLIEEGIVNKILDVIKTMDLTIELDKLQKERALGPPKHRKQVTDMFNEMKLNLAESIFCLACQQPLRKSDTQRLIAHLKSDNSSQANASLDPVTLCLLMSLLYCFDVSILEREDAEETVQKFPFMTDASYMVDLHREMTSQQQWINPGIKALFLFAWANMLRQLSQYPLPQGSNEFCEEDEHLMDSAIDGQVFNFINNSVLLTREFFQEEFYIRRIHGLITDFIYHMPLKVKELRNRGDETARIVMAHQNEGLQTPEHRRDFEELLLMMVNLYSEDTLNLELSLDYWCPAEPTGLQESMYHYRPPPRQVALYKFVRLAGDLLPAPLYVPYIKMITGLANSPQCAQHCFNLLKINGMNSGGSASMVSWDHIFMSLNQYYTSLRRETPSTMEASHAYRAVHNRGISAHELDGIIAVLKLTQCVIKQNENCRSAVWENQQWGVNILLFGLIGCSIPSILKAELLKTLAYLAMTPAIAANIWQTLEIAQILPTIPTTTEQTCGIVVELEEIESRNEEYHMTRAFLLLLNQLTNIPIPAALGAGYRPPGFDPYLEFIINNVFLKFYTRAYKNTEEKWEIAVCTLEIMCKLLHEHEVKEIDFIDQVVEIQGGGAVSTNKPPGHVLLLHMLNDSGLLKMILRVLDDSVQQFENYTSFPGKKHLEKASLLSLRMIELALEKEEKFETMIRESGSPVMIATMDKLLLSINPRSRTANHLVNIAKFVMFNTLLPEQAFSASRILYLACRSAPIQTELVNLFTVDENVNGGLMQGFVECLECDEIEPILNNKHDIHAITPEEEFSTAHIKNATRQHIIQLMLYAMEQSAPNLAHWLLGFELRKPVTKTNLQDPGILGSPKTCLHSILTLLNDGVGSRNGPTCLTQTPRLAELCYHLIYILCANKDTTSPILRYLRTAHDFLYRQLQHLPFKTDERASNCVGPQSWLLKTVAIELRLTSLNRQRSHTQRLLHLLLDDSDEAPNFAIQAGVTDETDVSGWDRESSMFISGAATQNKTIASSGKRTRRKLLCLLDSVSFNQDYPEQLQLDFFDPKLIEQVISNCESKTENDVIYCEVRTLHRILMSELNNQQGSLMAGQRPLIMGEIQQILGTVVLRNKVRGSLYTKRQSFEAWRQVAEVLLTACPEDVLNGETRQTVIFELLQDLLLKVATDDSLPELTAPVAGVVLTLMANLLQCFISDVSQSERVTHATGQYDNTGAGAGDAPGIRLTRSTWSQSAGSRTLFATSLQIVLKGLIDYILKTSAGSQRVRANLYGALLYYLQIAQKPETLQVKDDNRTVSRVLGSSDTEYEQLSKENLSTIMAYGDNLMDVVCKDACDGHDIGRMLALSVLDMIVSTDVYQQWLTYLSGKGYLQHLIDSLLQDDVELQKILRPNPDQIRVLYIYQSKMSLLTRFGETTAGAHILIRCGIMQKLSACSFFDLRPDSDRTVNAGSTERCDDEFIPNPLVRYRILLSSAIKLCLAVLTSVGVESKDIAAQVMLFVVTHNEVFTTILRDRGPSLSLAALRELALTTSLISRANYHTDLGSEYLDSETAIIEFKGHRARIQRQMLSLLPRYCFSEKFSKQLRNMDQTQHQGNIDVQAGIILAFQEISANLISYCKSLLTESATSSQYSRILFGPCLDEAGARDLQTLDDYSVTSLSTTQTPNLGIIIYQLKQSTNQFMTVFDSHRQHEQKLASLSDLSTDDLKEFSTVGSTEKMSSQQRQLLAKKRLQQIVRVKTKELQHLACILYSLC
ncbi:nuclear pore complex protein Nup205 [Patella vulgata]|uniref:nuclear pore complex protein Nup205 n=1 Tax=Patella vulgata TaxID=6465 RepID=UPI0024A94F49|nr:nuclear pore complex protein Nup205 [Patella vulgata]